MIPGAILKYASAIERKTLRFSKASDRAARELPARMFSFTERGCLEQKDLIGLALLVIGVFGGAVASSCSKRLRDFIFLGMIVLAPMTEDYDVNFVSRDFYRGTTRGFEFSLVDILSISLLASLLLVPRGRSRGYWPA